MIAYHVRQSFKPGEITPEEANRLLGVEFAKRFTQGQSRLCGLHPPDKSHVHNHIIWSAVNADCDRKFRNFWGSTRAVRRLSEIPSVSRTDCPLWRNAKPHGKEKLQQVAGRTGNPSIPEQLRVMIDRALEQK